MSLSDEARVASQHFREAPEQLQLLQSQAQRWAELVAEGQRHFEQARHGLADQRQKLQSEFLSSEEQLRSSQEQLKLHIETSRARLASQQQGLQQGQAQLEQSLLVLKAASEDAQTALLRSRQVLEQSSQALGEQVDGFRRSQEQTTSRLHLSLNELESRLQRYGQRCDQWAAWESELVEQFSSELESYPPRWATARNEAASALKEASSRLQAALQELQVGQLKPGLERLAAETREGWQLQVHHPVQVALQELIETGLQPLERQLRHQVEQAEPLRQQVERSLQEMQSGPQLLALLKASKEVLQKVGKLSSLGPLANTL